MAIRTRSKLRSVSAPVLVIASAVLFLVIVSLGFIVITGSFGIPAAIVTAAIPIALSLVGQFVTNDLQNKREVAAKLREQNSRAYEQFIKFWMDMLILPENQRKRKAGQIDQDKLMRDMNDLSQPLMLWASNDVVRTYADFRRMANRAEREQQAVPPLETMFAFEDRLFLMREDMGHSSLGARRGDLLSFFIKDLETMDSTLGTSWALGQKPSGHKPI